MEFQKIFQDVILLNITTEGLKKIVKTIIGVIKWKLLETFNHKEIFEKKKSCTKKG